MDAFKIIGISVRTINRDNQAKKDIDTLWNRWFAEHIATKIPNKISDAIYNMYTDYESDVHGYYTTILGCQVDSLSTIPQGMIGKQVAAGKYKEFIATGKLPDCVVKTWETIWGLKYDRSYQADFDIYEMANMDPENATVKTYLSIN